MATESKTTTIRLDDEIQKMLLEISTKPTTAAQTAIEVLLWMRRATIHELKGRFTPQEITALADSFNGLMPTWQVMCNPEVFSAHTSDAEKYQGSASNNGADITLLTEKIRKLTAAQATIIQLELWAFWNRDTRKDPDLPGLIKLFS